MIRAMQQGLDRTGVACWTGLKVENLTDAHGIWTATSGSLSVSARHMLLATNAFAQDLVEVDVHPVANQVLVSQVMPGLKLDHTVHHDRGYVYVREVEGRLLIGGGRQWDCPNDDDVAERLTAWATKHVVGCDLFKVAHRWKGQLGIGRSRRPEVKTFKPGLHAGVRLGGMGVAIGTTVGRMLADLAIRTPT
jgi:glycine/D-amino acid oxidase-like deaminating enzyme